MVDDGHATSVGGTPRAKARSLPLVPDGPDEVIE